MICPKNWLLTAHVWVKSRCLCFVIEWIIMNREFERPELSRPGHVGWISVNTIDADNLASWNHEFHNRGNILLLTNFWFSFLSSEQCSSSSCCSRYSAWFRRKLSRRVLMPSMCGPWLIVPSLPFLAVRRLFSWPWTLASGPRTLRPSLFPTSSTSRYSSYHDLIPR